MKTKLIQFIALTLLTLGSLLTSMAAPMGTAFNYQGRLYDQGIPVSGYYDFEFRLYGSANGNDLVSGTPDHFALSAVLVTNGLFTVHLDFGAGAFNGPARWLSTSVRTNTAPSFALLNPRQELKPAPYALYAEAAGSASVATSVSPGGVTAAGLALGAVGSLAIMDGSILPADLSPMLLNDSFWRLLGNMGTDPDVNFLGTIDDKALTIRVNNTRALQILPTATPSLVGGHRDNSISGSGSVIAGGGIPLWPNKIVADWSAIVGGISNLITARGATVGGGNANLIVQTGGTNVSESSFIGGGNGNMITNGFVAFIGGGNHNRVSAQEGAIGGGGFNLVFDTLGTVGGGGNNQAGQEAVVGGGFGNHADGRNSTIAGGTNNAASGSASTVAGGQNNSASGQYSGIAGGISNTNTAPYAAIGGGFGNRTGGQDAVVAGGSANAATAGQSTIGGGIGNRATASQSTVGGGALNTALAVSATVAGGQNNLVGTNIFAIEFGSYTNVAKFGTIAGGLQNKAYAEGSAIGGGGQNLAVGDYSVIAGGEGNRVGITNDYSTRFKHNTIGGGQGNSAFHTFGTVAGGASNVVGSIGSFADYATIPGGLAARARNYGQQAYASGQFAQAGDAQASLYVLRGMTTNNVQGDLNLDGNHEVIYVPFGSVWALRIQVSAAQVTGTNFAAYEASGVVANLDGTAAVLYLRDGAGVALGTAKPIFETPNAVSWQATPYVNGGVFGGTGFLRLAVNGGAGQGTIKWVATLQATELLK